MRQERINKTMKQKRILAFILSLAMILSMVQTNIAFAAIDKTIFEGGTGTESDPFQIGSLAQLEAFRDSVNSGNTYKGYYIRLKCNIDMSNTYSSALRKSWKTIGTSSTPFQGTFDGSGYLIKVFYSFSTIKESENDYRGKNTNCGLFGYVGNGGTIKNLAVNGSVQGEYNVGGIVGCIESTKSTEPVTIENCSFFGTSIGKDMVGGIVGKSSANTSIKCCYNIGTLESATGQGLLGGIVGDNAGTVENCYNTGEIKDTSVPFGGISGYSENSIKYCYSIGSGITASTADKNVSDCYYYKDVKGDVSGTYITMEEFKEEKTFVNWDFENVWSLGSRGGGIGEDRPYLLDNYENFGTEENPYQISTAEDLKQLHLDVQGGASYSGKYFKMTNDIDCTVPPIGAAGSQNLFAGTFDGGGYVIKNTIKNYSTYVGIFGRVSGVIKNLNVVATITGDEYVGGIAGSLEGGRIENCYVSGDIGGGTYAGGIAGRVKDGGKVENCSFSGNVTNTDNCGGIVGNLNRSTVNNCYALGSVTGERHAGGVVGWRAYGTISNCYSDTTVKGEIGQSGIFGSAKDEGRMGTTTNSYYRGDKVVGELLNTYGISKTASDFSDGSVAWALQNGQTAYAWGQKLGTDNLPVLTSSSDKQVNKITFMTNSSTDDNPYSVIYVNQNIAKDKFPAEPTSDNYYFSKWVADKDNLNGEAVTEETEITKDMTLYAVGNKFITASGEEDTIKLRKKAAIEEIDLKKFVTIQSDAENDNFTFALSEDSNLPAGIEFNDETGKISGTPTCSAGIYTIKFDVANDNGIALMSVETSASGIDELTIKLDIALEGEGTKEKPYIINDLSEMEYFRNDVNNGNAYEGDYVELATNIDLRGSETNQWTPIGLGSNIAFSGIFNGNGKEISRLYINDTTSSSVRYMGLFGYISGATIKNLTVDGSISGTNLSYSGGIVGSALGEGIIENCRNKASVTSSMRLRHNVIGGIVGSAASLTIKCCYNTGNISGAYMCVGGIAGYVYQAIVQDCYNTGDVSTSYDDEAYVGGIVGKMSSASLKNSYNIGKVTAGSGATLVGGAVGAAQENSSVESVYYLEGCNGENTSFDSKNGMEKSAADFKNEKSFDGWNFADTWVMDEIIGRPDLRTALPGIPAKLTTDKYDLDNDSTNDNVFEIGTAEELMWFAYRVNNGNNYLNAVLTADIDLDGCSWTPIGVNYSDFKGIFDGQGHNIYNMKFTTEQNGYSNHPEYNYQGLFGVMRDKAEVRNFTIKGEITLYTDEEINYVGGAVGLAYEECKISNVTSYVNITDGGVGYEQVECVGGVVGRLGNPASNGTPGFAENCKYYGTISINKGGKVGGIVGAAIEDSFVTNCTNYGMVGWDYIAHLAGIVGAAQSGTNVKNCANYGDVTSGRGDCVGGVVGYANEYVTITNCSNGGSVKAKKSADEKTDVFLGGILGYQNNSNFNGITNCFNYGTITATDGGKNNTGAIIGCSRNATGAKKVKDNYYLKTSCDKACGSNDGSNNTSVDAITAASGEVAYKMQSYITDGEQVWGQTLSSENYDMYPVIGGAKVYSGTKCNGSAVYANDEIHAEHSYVGGACQYCGASENITKNNDGYYQIGSKAEYIHFTNLVNTNGEADTLNAVLTNDIDLAGYDYIPIGKDGSRYIGIFDGAGHKIENMTITANVKNMGMFGCTLNAEIKNFTISGDITAVCNTLEHIGGVIGYANGTSVSDVISKVNFKDNGRIEHIFKAGGIAARAVGDSYFANCEYSGNIELHFGSHMAGILGEANESTKENPIVIVNCVNKANMTFDISRRVAGILGWNDTYTTILQCANYGNITIEVSDSINQAGGIVAANVNALMVEDCANYGNITDGKYNSSLGGIVGFIDAYKNTDDFGGIVNCFNYGKITNTNENGSTYWGSVIGYIKNNDTNSGILNKITNNYYSENTAPTIYGTDGAAITATEVTKRQAESGEIAYTLQGSRTDTIWGQTLTGEKKTPYPVPNGNKVYKVTFMASGEIHTEMYANSSGIGTLPDCPTEGDTWRLGETASSVEFTAQTPVSSDITVYAVNRKSKADIKISTVEELKNFAKAVNGGESYEGKYILLTADLDLGGSKENQWTPIGTYSNPFKGTFDGAGHKISGLYIDADSNYQGLFGCVSFGILKNFVVYGNVSARNKCYYVGGIVGNMSGGTILNCGNFADVTGYISVGGICGLATDNVKAENCFNTGTIIAVETDSGGIFGRAYATVVNCYNTGAIEAWDVAGGMIGSPDNSKITTVTDCYNTGRAYAGIVQDIGYGDYSSISGNNSSNVTITNCYTSYQCSETTSVKCISTEDMNNSLSFNDWDFENTWIIYEGRPILRRNPELRDFKITAVDSATAQVTAFITVEGTYMVVFADYESDALNDCNMVMVKVTEDNLGVNTITSTNDITLSAGDKVMLWDSLNNMMPMYRAYEIK